MKIRRVPTVMLGFDREYHGPGSRPSNFMRRQLYMMSWFQKHRLGGEAAASSEGNR